MIKELITDDAVLSQPCKTATTQDAPVAQDLSDTLCSLDDAVCLAANQIGVPTCIVAYLDDKNKVNVMYNPVLKRAFGAFKTTEGCLSRETTSKVTRYNHIQVAYDKLQDGILVPQKKELSGWTAQIVQHMIDHCKGKLV